MAMATAETPDLYFPLLADLYFPIMSQGTYGEIKKDWVFDRTIAIGVEPYSRKGAGEITPKTLLQYKDILVARSRTDLRLSERDIPDALTNVLITNIRSTAGVLMYQETAGPRKGRGTIYEIASYEPHLAPYGDVDYYAMVIRRSENQAAS